MNTKFLVVRSIYEKPDISQRDLAKKFSVSLGKINAVLKDAEADGLIERVTSKNKDLKENIGSYKIKKDGENLLKKNKVDGALILACGMGVRLAPLTYDTPKSFIKIKGEKMIERQIGQLKSVGINDITIMVGYLKEHFDYLVDKYSVKLIYNEEYKDKNTLATLYHARDVIKNKNMYVCVSDVYITENIYHTYECEPYYTGAFYEDCKNEWRYLTNSKNEVKGVELGGKDDYCLVGPCFLTKEFSEKLIPEIERLYGMSKTDNYYWEEAFVYDTKKFPTIYVYKHDNGVIFEFDSLKDIKAFDKDTSEYGSEAITFVSKALKIKESEIEDIECVKEGMTNKSYKFKSKGTTYIARIPGEGTNKFIDRKAEYEVYEKIKDKCITEELVFFDKNNGYKISKYFENAKPIDINREVDLRNTMELYAKFHSLGVKVSTTCDIIDKVDEYLNIIKKKEINIPYEDFDEVLKNARELEKIVIAEKRPKVLCHGDPNPGNVLYTSDGLKLIDFEYAGMADPLSDIALFGIYVGFDIEKTLNLYKMYKNASRPEDDHNDMESARAFMSNRIGCECDKAPLGCSASPSSQKLIVCYMALGGLYNALWAIVREALSGTDYGCFGLDGYRTFKKCYKYLKEEA